VLGPPEVFALKVRTTVLIVSIIFRSCFGFHYQRLGPFLNGFFFAKKIIFIIHIRKGTSNNTLYELKTRHRLKQLAHTALLPKSPLFFFIYFFFFCFVFFSLFFFCFIFVFFFDSALYCLRFFVFVVFFFFWCFVVFFFLVFFFGPKRLPDFRPSSSFSFFLFPPSRTKNFSLHGSFACAIVRSLSLSSAFFCDVFSKGFAYLSRVVCCKISKLIK